MQGPCHPTGVPFVGVGVLLEVAAKLSTRRELEISMKLRVQEAKNMARSGSKLPY